MQVTKIDNLANQVVFSETLQKLAEKDNDILIVTSDSSGSGKLVPFGEKFPDQVVEVGIAEQNLVSVAAGIASMGKKAFAVSPACFLTARSLEQIKNDVCYSNNPVKLIGISAGVSYGALGSTHHSLHDFAVLRAINNITIVAPADNFETEEVVKQAAKFNSPIYLRFGKKGMPDNLQDEVAKQKGTFQIGKARILNEGSDLTFIAAGEAVLPCKKAAELLMLDYNISCKVVSMHTIKPLDNSFLEETLENNQPVITVEEHSIHGGLGEAVGSFLFQKGFKNKFKIVGLPDDQTVTGSQTEIFNHYGISANGLSKTALALLKENC